MQIMPTIRKQEVLKYIAHLNVRSLIKHIDELKIYLDKQQFDIISQNETMLALSVPNHEIKLNGYEIVRKDRNRHGRGVQQLHTKFNKLHNKRRSI
jgi:phosphoribosyl-dephospho-CoA transferase